MPDFFGTDADEDVIGGSGNDRLFGFGGKDRLYAKGGNDELYAGSGNDLLDGGAGADIMLGGAGNDTYRVDDASDFVSEQTVAGTDDGGLDTVNATVSFTLGAFIERLTLTGTGNISGIGNELDNRLLGNSGINYLAGGGGGDTISADGGDDMLDGGAGSDTLTGGFGADTFVFAEAEATSSDTITDFSADDWIGIDGADFGLSLGSGVVLDALGVRRLDALYFTTISGAAANQGTATDHGQFLFNATTRQLMWDADGAGAQAGITLATLTQGSIGAEDFAILGVGPPPPLSVRVEDAAPALATEGTDAIVTFRITLSEAAADDIVIGYTTVDGSAVQGSDFAERSGQVIIAAGSLSATVVVSLLNDSVSEAIEQFALRIDSATLASSGNAVAITDSIGSATIVDEDLPPPPPVTVAVADATPVPVVEAAASTALFRINLSHAASQDIVVAYHTVGGSGVQGSDFQAASGEVVIAAGATSATVSVNIIDDTVTEAAETFTLQIDSASIAATGQALTVIDASGAATIAANDQVVTQPSVVRIHDMRPLGSTDPSGLAYVSTTGKFMLSDSEVDEAPFNRTNNLLTLNPDGTLVTAQSLSSFTREPTGLAYDPGSNRLYVSDDDLEAVFWVDPAAPTVRLGSFNARALGAIDVEDVAVDTDNGHVFIINGLDRRIVETNSAGTQVYSSVVLPSVIKDPEAIVYDTVHDVFYVGGGFSANIWRVDRSGAIVDTISLLTGYRNPVGDTRVHVKDLELAPTSDPTDDPSRLNLYVADYGNSHVNDGRLFEIYLGDPFWG